MKIGFFTDTYFPQVSGVSTSIKTLKEQLELKGHEVYIFTTTDPKAPKYERNIIRMPSVPFVSFKERRIVVRGFWFAYLKAKEYDLDLIHTHTEFGAGLLGKWIGKRLDVPVIHTYHTMYEDYLHYIAKGKVLRPSYVKFLSREFVDHSSGVVCPSQRVVDTLRRYGARAQMRIIPTGIDVEKFIRPDITQEMSQSLREKWGIMPEQKLLLSLSRLSYEKNIHKIIEELPQVITAFPEVRLMIVGDGPYRANLESLVAELGLTEVVVFVGEVPADEVAHYYHAADYFVSASTSETQGLTYTEAMASGTQMIVAGNAYLDQLITDYSLGQTYDERQGFSASLIEYLTDNPAKNPAVVQQKLYEISAEFFGESMIAFYCEVLNQYVEKKFQERKDESRLKTRLRQFKILTK
ncbi:MULTISPECIES: glycosyltransferase family 4 protein [Enterococcus]|uniref:Glycosyl transferase n=1 Tax=Enterococcus alcedinis TaxID=1274384 RepID=A0A917JF21_9ENTE|nr:glycosyltransferase family 4 protein [Enterococcus alcedinis]MBP2102443.1 1,2-diacylglycerol 3-alpha-glucosyltransferase [Enterococcus alcedinis]GGI66023.1 glycosyl transferase [Enterococcus alcedinis]